jgi:type VII secretion-associated serine protease mycosin
MGNWRGRRSCRLATTRATHRSGTGDRPPLKVRGKVAATIGAALFATLSTPSSPAFADNVRDRQWYLQSLKISQTRTITTGSGIVVAVVDTGTYPHPDLRRNILDGIDQASGGGGDGKTDANGHGTRMAALIAGHGRGTSSGIQGIAPTAKILPVRISKTGRSIDSSVMAKGVAWAASNGAKVINISASTGPGFDLQDAVSAAANEDVVVVAAVGNTSSDAIVNYPAAFDGVLAVGATGRDGKHASVSVKDAKVQICAPGVDIISAQPRERHGTASGTSDSAAIVSGAAALVRAKFPQLSAEEVVHRLTATADDIGPPGRDDECGFGRLNIVKALTANVPPLQGSADSTPSADTTTAAASAPAPTGAAPDAEAAGGSAPVILGGLVGLAVAGGLAVMLAVRRRRNG